MGIQQALAQLIGGSWAMENKIVAILDLSKEEAMLTTGLPPLFIAEEGSQAIEPSATTNQRSCAARESANSWSPWKSIFSCSSFGRPLRKTAIPKSNAILVMLVEKVRGQLLCGEIPEA
jgi:hypothetical protein